MENKSLNQHMQKHALYLEQKLILIENEIFLKIETLLNFKIVILIFWTIFGKTLEPSKIGTWSFIIITLKPFSAIVWVVWQQAWM